MTSSKGVREAGPRRVTTAAAVVALLVLGAFVVALQALRDRRFPPAAASEELLYVRSPAVLKRLALSFDAVLADVYWIRAIQYYGGTRLSAETDKNYELLYPLLDLTTSLDPEFSIAYRFGAFFLSEEKPGGADRPDLAIRLLDKAMLAHPDRWEYPYDVAFVYYREGDYQTAAEWFLRASERPGATPWLKPLAAVVLGGSGDTASARVLWRTLLDSETEWMRRTAEHRLTQLDAIDQVAELERLTAAYERRFGVPPAGWQDMMRAGMLRGIPLDPAGHPYVLRAGGDVTVSNGSPMWPLPTDPPA